MKRLLLVLTLLLAVSTFASNNPAGVKVTNNGNDYLIEYQLPAYTINEISKDGEKFIKLAIDGYGITSEAGYPELPQISFNLVVPSNVNEENLQVLSSNLNHSNIYLNSKIYPFQAPWSKSEPLSKRPFNYIRSYYETEGRPNQPIIKISEPFNIGGVTGVMVTIYPFNYNPVRNTLKAVTSGNFTIKLPQAIENTTGHSESYNSYLKEIFTAFTPNSSSKGMNYLIITAPDYETKMQQFVTYKSAGGYNVTMFTTATTGTTTSAIKTFIQNRYNDPNLKPEYILLVGDVDKIPYWVGSGEGTPSTDLNYGLLQGTDHYADAFVGRFSVSSTTELQNIIDKTIYMTNNIGSLPKKNVFMASTDNSSITEGTHNYVINTYFAPNNYDNLKLYTVTYNATTQQVTSAINDGKQFAIYSGHGGETSWADGPAFSQANVRALTNTVYPFVYSFACVTGSYQIAESFGETWIRIAKGGASFYGSSVNSYWDEDDILERELIKAMFVDDLTKVTPMMDKAKVYLVNHFGLLDATMKRYLEMYNLMGDPSLPTKRQILPDTDPPAAITDLSTSNETSNSITLNWTAPADTTFGGIMSYDIRYSKSNIGDDAQFNNATSVIYGGNTDSAGTPKSYTVTGLEPNTNYYFAVKARDLWVNYSPMSNVVNKSTLVAPIISVNPTSLNLSLQVNTTQFDTITINNINTANSTLDYTVELKNNTFPTSAKVTATLVPVIKEKTNVFDERRLKESTEIEFG
ncbi:MAG TPA: C25 family cysteine peptidase, partial [Melioribacteraceae bacterium]|nr:C25 family cysteine peptidase [Melioribacteraceae bacterium]